MHSGAGDRIPDMIWSGQKAEQRAVCGFILSEACRKTTRQGRDATPIIISHV